MEGTRAVQTTAPTTEAPTVAPAVGRVLQRACACGKHAGNGGECAECRKKRLGLQRRAVGQGPDVAPPIVHEVLRSPGRPLDEGTRGFMESRFNHDFSGVRVHTDGRAAESARAVSALAYTVGQHVVFGPQRYQPGTGAGRQLLAHELTHTLQQPNPAQSSAPSAVLPLEEAGGSHEMEAQLVARNLSGFPAANPHPPAIEPGRLVLQRWAIADNVATSDAPTDTLGGLAQRVGAHFNDWTCIRPISMRTFSGGRGTSDQKRRYERFVQNGDQFDTSNLTATTGVSLRIHLFDPGAEWKDARLAGFLYPGSIASPNQDVDLDISNAAGEGKTPVQEFIIFGHAAGQEMWGGWVSRHYRPVDYKPEEPTPSFAEAEFGLMPRRCWFTRNAAARSVGCNSTTFGTDFAAAYLRSGADIVTTTAAVRPKCQGLPFFVGTQLGVPGGCAWYNGVDFASGSGIGATSVEGPFWSVADFHAAGHWATVAGSL